MAVGPSVIMGPTASGPTQTAASQSPRLDRRATEEEEDDRKKEEEVMAEARRRVADAKGLAGAVFSVASKALEQSERRQWPTIALAGRFVWKGGCGCSVCAESEGEEGRPLGLRKCSSLTDEEQEVLARLVRTGWRDGSSMHQHPLATTYRDSRWNCDVCHRSGCGRTRYRCTVGCDWDMCGECREKDEGREKKNALETPKSAEQRLEATLSHWLSHFCCSIVSTCADCVHPAVVEMLEQDELRVKVGLPFGFWVRMVEDYVEKHGTAIGLGDVDALTTTAPA